MTSLNVERMARAIHADHGLLVWTCSYQDLKTGKWIHYTHDYCLNRDKPLAEKLVAAYAAQQKEKA